MSETIPLSYLSQYGYCPRRAGLLLLEQAWSENEYTASGRVQHERVHSAGIERRGNRLTMLEYPIASEALGLSGKCDCIEATASAQGIALPGETGKYTLYPIEYKHGVVRDEREYQLQLCAQAMCLEEMFGGHISCGALYFTDARRRDAVELTEVLRTEVRRMAAALQELLAKGRVPPGKYGSKCKKCSMLNVCDPRLSANGNAYCMRLYTVMEEPEA